MSSATNTLPAGSEAPVYYEIDEHPHPEGHSTLLGFWIYLMSDCLIFAILFACYAVLGGNFAAGPGPKDLFDLNLIALNTAISHLRAQAPASRDVPLDGHADALVAEGAFDPETHERLGLLRRFMATLGPLDRALLLLYLEERSGREMAEVLGIGQSNVSTRINRIRQRLRDYAAARFQD